jgi:peptide/nickel transport system ATP-binding protein
MKKEKSSGRASSAAKSMEAKRIDTPYAVEVKDLVVHYETSTETVQAVNGIDLKLKKTHALGLVGETGAGKTTTMLALMNMIPNPPGVLKDGQILVNGLDMRNLTPAELQNARGSEIAMIFQDPMTSLNPVMTVGDQIAESIRLHRDVTNKEAMEMAKDMLKTVGIDPNRSGEYPHQFSGGMRQRVGIAIALACKPAVLIADEPTSALDVTIQAQILYMMRQLKQENDTSMILITHDLGVVAEMCDEVAVMYAGRIVEYGTLEEVFNHTKHPYTEGLFNSLPNIHQRQSKLQPIPGLMPDPANLPEGCAFAPRCPYATDACRAAQPTVAEFSDTHYAACTGYQDPAFHINRG